MRLLHSWLEEGRRNTRVKISLIGNYGGIPISYGGIPIKHCAKVKNDFSLDPRILYQLLCSVWGSEKWPEMLVVLTLRLTGHSSWSVTWIKAQMQQEDGGSGDEEQYFQIRTVCSKTNRLVSCHSILKPKEFGFNSPM